MGVGAKIEAGAGRGVNRSKQDTVHVALDAAGHQLIQEDTSVQCERGKLNATVETADVMMTTIDGTTAKAMAETAFKKQGPGDFDEGRRAQEAVRLAEAEKIARLRALRLAKEEADRIAAEIRRVRRERRKP